jgi:DNA-binding beta-propeller fold protein YncE
MMFHSQVIVLFALALANLVTTTSTATPTPTPTMTTAAPYLAILTPPTISTFAGSVTFGNGGPPQNAYFLAPASVAVDSVNDLLYISDTSNHIVRVIDRTANIITTFAGILGSSGHNGDNGTATSIKLSSPNLVTVDTTNNLVYIADFGNNCVRVVNCTTNNIATFAGVCGSSGKTGDGGVATIAKLSAPSSVAIDTINNLVYIVDKKNYAVRVVNRTSNIITTFAGIAGSSGSTGDGGKATSAKLTTPNEIGLDMTNNLVYITDNSCVRVVNRSSNIITTFAGTCGAYGNTGDNGPKLKATFNLVSGVTIDNNLVYVTDSTNNRIRVINQTSNMITAFAGVNTTSLSKGYSGDGGPAGTAKFYSPTGIAIDSVNSKIYVADTSNNVIRVIDSTNNTISTYAGDVTMGETGLATAARFMAPFDVEIDTKNNLVYILDYNNYAVRVVNRATNMISTFAGTIGSTGSTIDNVLATSAKLPISLAIAVDNVNNFVYITVSSSCILVIDTTMYISTVRRQFVLSIEQPISFLRLLQRQGNLMG